MKKILLAVALGLLIARPIFAAESEEGFKPMFDGKDLAGWDGSPDLWSVKDGAITGQTTAEHPAKENTFLIYTNSQPGDFELRCSYKLVANNSVNFANSGIQYRSRIVKPSYWVISGYQADMEVGDKYSGILYEEKARGIIALRGEKVEITAQGRRQVVGSLGKSEEIQAAIKKNDWNDYVVIAHGNHLRQFINGKQTIDLIDNDPVKSAKSGVIALQLHAGQPMTVQFKDLRIKEIK